MNNPIMDIVVTLRDKAPPPEIEGVAYREIGVSSVTVFGEVWGL